MNMSENARIAVSLTAQFFGILLVWIPVIFVLPYHVDGLDTDFIINRLIFPLFFVSGVCLLVHPNVLGILPYGQELKAKWSFFSKPSSRTIIPLLIGCDYLALFFLIRYTGGFSHSIFEKLFFVIPVVGSLLQEPIGRVIFYSGVSAIILFYNLHVASIEITDLNGYLVLKGVMTTLFLVFTVAVDLVPRMTAIKREATDKGGIPYSV